MSLSSCSGSNRPHEPQTSKVVKGQSSRLKTHTVPGRENILIESQLRQTPACPKKCSQELVTKKGGKASARIAAPKKAFRQALGKPASHRANKNPKLTDRTVLKAATSRLFRIKSQLI